MPYYKQSDNCRMFTKIQLNHRANLFEDLICANRWEELSSSRKCAILNRCNGDHIPIVRTTTAYSIPSQPLASIHHQLITEIQKAMVDAYGYFTDFNNVMAEHYTPCSTKMGFHSDQALDLAASSYICILSLYEDENEPHPKKLVMKHKASGEVSALTLDHDSLVFFSTSTNDHFVHKIVSDEQKCTTDWLGLTFRLSDTFVQNIDGLPRLVRCGRALKLASEDERKEFFRHKKKENSIIGYRYPEIPYALSLLI